MSQTFSKFLDGHALSFEIHTFFHRCPVFERSIFSGLTEITFIGFMGYIHEILIQ